VPASVSVTRRVVRISNGVPSSRSRRWIRSEGGLPDEQLPRRAHGRDEEARAVLNEALALYDGMQARWDIRRAESRLRACGIRRGPRGRRSPRAASGWEALTPTEVTIAALVARGDSTSDIAQSMFLSRRTVQTYISRILTKLDAKSRVEIAGEALRHGVTP
jgi:DNA-binding CsgD family transcriptional regulator